MYHGQFRLKPCPVSDTCHSLTPTQYRYMLHYVNFHFLKLIISTSTCQCRCRASVHVRASEIKIPVLKPLFYPFSKFQL